MLMSFDWFDSGDHKNILKSQADESKQSCQEDRKDWKRNLWCVWFGFNLWLQWLWVMFKIYGFNFWLIFKICVFSFWFAFMSKNAGFTFFFFTSSHTRCWRTTPFSPSPMTLTRASQLAGPWCVRTGAEPQQGLGGPWPPQNFKKLFYIMYKY